MLNVSVFPTVEREEMLSPAINTLPAMIPHMYQVLPKPL